VSQTAEWLRAVAAMNVIARLARQHGASIPTDFDDATAARLQRELDELVPRLAVVEHVLADVERDFRSEVVTPDVVRHLLGATHGYVAEVLEIFPTLTKPDPVPELGLLRQLNEAVRDR